MLTMGADGWIGLSWKKEFGGKELSPIEQYIFVETVMRTGFPVPISDNGIGGTNDSRVWI